MTMLGSMGLAYKPDATRVANIGMGSGMTTHVVLASRIVETVDTIEIEPVMVEASRLFGEFVARAHEDPRSNIVIEDAKTFFSLHNSVYDLIIAEPSNPWVSGVASLFSTEFYKRIRRHLEDDGIFVQWIQLYEFNDELAVSILKSLSENFSDFVIYAVDDGNILLIARNNGPMGEPEWSALFDSPIAAEFSKVEIHSPADLEIRKISGREVLAGYLQSQSTPTNSDYYPFVDLHAGQARFAGENAELFSSWLNAPFPVIEMLHHEQLEFESISKTDHLSRLVRIEAADWLYDFIVDGVAEDKQSEEGRVLSAWLREAAAYCEDDLDINRWFTYVQDLMIASLPYMSPEKGERLIDAVDRSECESQQFPVILRWFDLYRAIANRDAAAMATIGKDLIEIMPSEAPSAHRGYLLDVLMLAHIAEGRFEAANANWQQYGVRMYEDGPLPGYMALLVAMAEGPQPKD